MKKISFLIIGMVLFTSPSWANVFGLYKVRKIPGTFYFTPAVSSREFAIFGYMSKITPTPEEVEAEKKRINTIIDESVKKGYGSWENFEKQMRKAGKEAAEEESKKAPSWLKSLLPPSLIKESVPLLMKGALLYAKAHPGASREPIGNVGETGIIIVDKLGNVTKIPLGINAPVESLAISPDGKIAAVLTDMSFEDKKGRLHRLAEISFIDLNAKKRIYSRIFANLEGHIAFVPGLSKNTYWLAFDYYTGVKDFKEVGFFDLRTRQVLKHRFKVSTTGSGLCYGKSISFPNFIFGLDPTSHTPIIALFIWKTIHKSKGPNNKTKKINKWYFEIYDVMTGKKLLTVSGDPNMPLVFAHSHPWIFTGLGEWWNYKTGQLLGRVKMSSKIPAIEVKFINNDRDIIYIEPFGCPKRFDTTVKRVVKSCDFYSYAGSFFLTPDEKFMLAFRDTGKGLVSYKGYLRREQLCLRIIDTEDLRLRQKICYKNSSVIDAAMAGNTLIVSDFDKLYVYKPFKNGV